MSKHEAYEQTFTPQPYPLWAKHVEGTSNLYCRVLGYISHAEDDGVLVIIAGANAPVRLWRFASEWAIDTDPDFIKESDRWTVEEQSRAYKAKNG